MTAEALAAALKGRRIAAGRWKAKCPAHPDRNPSLSIALERARHDAEPTVRAPEQLTVAQFCDRTGLTRRDWDLLKAQGRGPATTKVGSRIMITVQAEDDWLKRQERVSQSAPVTALGSRTGGEVVTPRITAAIGELCR